MRIRTLVGVVLIAAGIFLLARGWSYTSQRGVFQLGELKASVEEKRAVPPWVGGVVVVAGVVLLAAGRLRRGGT